MLSKKIKKVNDLFNYLSKTVNHSFGKIDILTEYRNSLASNLLVALMLYLMIDELKQKQTFNQTDVLLLIMQTSYVKVLLVNVSFMCVILRSKFIKCLQKVREF